MPLNLYLEHADEEHAREAITSTATPFASSPGANIFPGDLLLKNFGVTRYGRVVFYDYDELCELTECRFRRMPTPRDDDDEMAERALVLRREERHLPRAVPDVPHPAGQAARDRSWSSTATSPTPATGSRSRSA